MARRMLRYQVVVNDRPQTFTVHSSWSQPARVGASRLGVGPDAQHLVEFWVEGDEDGSVKRTFQVFGTGHPLPERARWWGTTARTSEGLVWHLYEVPGNEGQG
jgi:hypothetical protein